MANSQQLLALKSSIENYISALNKRVVVQDAGIVETDEELADLQGTEQSFEAVFNNWTRFSREFGSDLRDRANETDMNSWSYDSVNDRVVSTFNTNTYIGFISPTKHEDFVLEVKVKSTHDDDDFIGVCVAYAVDESGVTHTLDVLRSMNGWAPMGIFKNYHVYDAWNFTNAQVPANALFLVNDGLKWANGDVADGNLVPGSSKGGWNVVPNGCRIKVTRVGDIITVETTQTNTDTYLPAATRVIDLTSNPELEIFRGPQRFGYSCHSQAYSTWEVFSRPGSREPIFDIRNNTLYQWTGTEWQASVLTDNLPSIVKSGRFYINPVSGKLFFADSRHGFKKVMEAI